MPSCVTQHLLQDQHLFEVTQLPAGIAHASRCMPNSTGGGWRALRAAGLSSSQQGHPVRGGLTGGLPQSRQVACNIPYVAIACKRITSGQLGCLMLGMGAPAIEQLAAGMLCLSSLLGAVCACCSASETRVSCLQHPRGSLTSSHSVSTTLCPSAATEMGGSTAACPQVPMEAFEMNYIFGDGEGTVDNNGQQDYLTEVRGDMSRDQWLELAPEREVRRWGASVRFAAPWCKRVAESGFRGRLEALLCFADCKVAAS